MNLKNSTDPYNHYIMVKLTSVSDTEAVTKLIKAKLSCGVELGRYDRDTIVFQVKPVDNDLSRVERQVRRLGRGKVRFSIDTSWSEWR